MSLTLKSSDTTRLASGTLSTSTILGSSSYLVSNFARTNDMIVNGIQWDAIGENITDGQVITSIDGSSGLSGYSSGVIRLAMLTPQMGLYLLNTILQGKYTNDVTISVFHPIFGQTEYNCKLRFPALMSSVGEQANASIYYNVRLEWFRGTALGSSWGNSFDDSWG